MGLGRLCFFHTQLLPRPERTMNGALFYTMRVKCELFCAHPTSQHVAHILLPIAGVFFGYHCGGSVVGDKCCAKRFDMTGNCLKLGVASTC